MTQIKTYVQVAINGRWKASKEPRIVILEELCKNFPLCNRKLPSKKAKMPRFRQGNLKGYCTKECWKKYKGQGRLKRQKLNIFLKGVDSHD